MKKIIAIVAFLFAATQAYPQQNRNTAILKTILLNYYKQEKPIYKGRNQLLFFFCDKANNNEEMFETVNGLKLPPETARSIRQQVSTDVSADNWATELADVLAADKGNLAIKVNACLSLEQYQEKQKRFNLNNQRLMIVSKPVFYDNGKHALVKVVFYRSIEHNNGSVLLMENTENGWQIRDFLNPWST
ncbi:MAG: hypothetical protein EOO51_01875 [Flavobacterium sp.]|nr:MAG: hypothetical protein EOO51_01875 [Flavobacterium sp.]